VESIVEMAVIVTLRARSALKSEHHLIKIENDIQERNFW
jgi:hypothetical protein